MCDLTLNGGPLVCVLPADHAFGCSFVGSFVDTAQCPKEEL